MKKVRKFDTFDELKSSETDPADYALSLKRHSVFEAVIKEIMAIRLKKAGKNPVKD